MNSPNANGLARPVNGQNSSLPLSHGFGFRHSPRGIPEPPPPDTPRNPPPYESSALTQGLESRQQFGRAQDIRASMRRPTENKTMGERETRVLTVDRTSRGALTKRKTRHSKPPSVPHRPSKTASCATRTKSIYGRENTCSPRAYPSTKPIRLHVLRLWAKKSSLQNWLANLA